MIAGSHIIIKRECLGISTNGEYDEYNITTVVASRKPYNMVYRYVRYNEGVKIIFNSRKS